MASAKRSLTDDSGLKYSHFAYIVLRYSTRALQIVYALYFSTHSMRITSYHIHHIVLYIANLLSSNLKTSYLPTGQIRSEILTRGVFPTASEILERGGPYPSPRVRVILFVFDYYGFCSTIISYSIDRFFLAKLLRLLV